MQNNIEAKEKIKEILNHSEYTAYHGSKNFIEIWWERANEWIGDLLAKWFDSFQPTSGLSESIILTVILVTLGLICFLVVFIVKQVRKNITFRNHNPIQSIGGMEWSYQKHLQEAEKQAEEGQYTVATRHLFLSLLLFYHKRGWLQARDWKTNWEYYDELYKVNQKGATQFFNLALLFDEVTYGERDVRDDEFFHHRMEALKWMKDQTEDISSG